MTLAIRLLNALFLSWALPYTMQYAHAEENVRALNKAQQTHSEKIERGAYLARAANCAGCHSPDKSKPFAGGQPFATPFGTIYSSNLTPDKETGIGEWNDEDFIRALHNGIGKNGEHLNPVFPYTSFSKLSHDDVLAIRAYIFSMPAIRQQKPENDLFFPLGQQFLLAGWKLLNFRPGRWKPDGTKNAEYNRGMYLAEGLAHCQQCHTPRSLTIGLDYNRAFAGSNSAGWTAYNITSDQLSGVGDWTDEELVRYFKTGAIQSKTTATGPMDDVIEHSLQHLTEPDLRAIVAYLRKVPAIHHEADSLPHFKWGGPSHQVIYLRGTEAVTNNTTTSNGAELYSGNCASCHSADGSGIKDDYAPSMFHNTIVGAHDPRNLIMVILNGVQRHSQATTDSTDREIFMPAFASKLNDAEIALLSNYITRQFGNFTIPLIIEKEVTQLRNNGSDETDELWSSIKSFFQTWWQRIFNRTT